jgi:peptidoglycan/xylan/chitin deacetylase (PgdA/CDA1 family)
VILEPNRRRRTRVFRALSAILALLFVVTLVASGWTLPAISLTATASPTPVASIEAESAAPTEPGPSPSPSVAPPSPSPSAPVIVDGCVVPPAGTEPAIVASHGARTGKTIALTYDDGNDPQVVNNLLAVLKNQRVNATFFPTGRAVERFPDVWRRVAAAGYPIANHTYHHQSLKGMCYLHQLAELELAEQVIEGLGVPVQPLMRPPYEDFDEATRYASTSAGLARVVLWDVDTLDWTGIGQKAIVQRAMVGISGSIILMHLSSPAIVPATRTIIERYRERGFTFVTIGTMLGVDGPVPFP